MNDKLCSVEGCPKKAKKDGTKCSAHYRSIAKAAKAEKEAKPDGAKPSNDDELINSIIGGQPIISPPDQTKEQKDKADGQQKKDGTQAPLPAFPPSLWLMLAGFLNKALKTHAYDLDDASAKYLSDSLTLMLQEQNVKMSPTYAFIIAIGMWLGIGTVQFMMEQNADPKKDKTPVVGDVKQWFKRNKITPEVAEFVEQTPPSPQEEMVQVTMTVEEERLRNLQRPIPVSEPTKVKYLDLKAMEEQSRKAMAKVTEELKKKKLQSVLPGLSQ